jgi:hypothetical protein
MRIQTDYSSYEFPAHQQRSQRRCSFSQTALLWFVVLLDMSPALPALSPAVPGAPRPVVGAPCISEGRQECPPRVWYYPEIDASKFTLNILSDTPGGFQWLKYILRMESWSRVLMVRSLPASSAAWPPIETKSQFWFGKLSTELYKPHSHANMQKYWKKILMINNYPVSAAHAKASNNTSRDRANNVGLECQMQ